MGINSTYKKYTDKVIAIVSATDKYTFSDKNNKEIENIDIVSKMLYDAGKLGALGTVGIARAFSFGQ